MDDAATSRMFAMAARIAELEEQVASTQRYYLQTMLTIAHLAGGEVRIGAIDYAATKGLTLATFVDPKTGDRVFVAKAVEVDEGAAP